jgi:hypothetical protein
MRAADFLTSWDAAIFMAPFFGLLALWMFGLDERVTAPRDRSTRRRFCQSNAHDDSGFCDPDGKTAVRPTGLQPGSALCSGPHENFASKPAPKRFLLWRTLLSIQHETNGLPTPSSFASKTLDCREKSVDLGA